MLADKKQGGNIVYNGIPEGLVPTESIRGAYLMKSEKPVFSRKAPASFYEIRNVTANNRTSHVRH
jgi:excinuclease UvrABC ATPase subunit